MRLVACLLLVCAAFDWPPPFLDRVGAAALGLALWALVNPIGRSRVRRPAIMNLPAKPPPAADPLGEPIAGFAERLQGYIGGEATSS